MTGLTIYIPLVDGVREIDGARLTETGSARWYSGALDKSFYAKPGEFFLSKENAEAMRRYMVNKEIVSLENELNKLRSLL